VEIKLESEGNRARGCRLDLSGSGQEGIVFVNILTNLGDFVDQLNIVFSFSRTMLHELSY
jgi:hypothetical protein